MELESSESSPSLAPRDFILVAAGVVLGSGAFLLASALTYRLGFPLDDSWIHATYARNFAIHGQWAFQLGHLSAGSTAPLWTLLLVPGFWLHLEPLWWAYLLGCVALFSLAVLLEFSARRLVVAYGPALPWVGFFVVAEWHMLWGALSGMETILQALLTTGVLVALILGSRRYLALGVLTGLSVWVRPDGITLLIPVMVTIVLVEREPTRRWRSLSGYLIGFGALFVPYLLLNLWLSGTPMPNTFYAKQAEYAAWQARPLLYRLGVSLLQLLTGSSILLVPGLLLWLVESIKKRRVAMLAAGGWCVLYILLYVVRLPSYQHGRYIIPAMPIFFLYGLLGHLEFRRGNCLGSLQLAAQRAWQLALILLTAGFTALGARAYAQDVGLIESEMVNTAEWVAQHIPPESIVAAHDIGALGYFDHHRLIDLAGLVSPEIVPIVRDEPRLAAFLDAHGANYLIAFPAFYPELTKLAKPVFSSGGNFARELGEQNMTVYCWSCR